MAPPFEVLAVFTALFPLNNEVVTENTPATLPRACIAPPKPLSVEFPVKVDPEIVRFVDVPIKFIAPPLVPAVLLEKVQLVMVRLPKPLNSTAPPAPREDELSSNTQLVNDTVEAPAHDNTPPGIATVGAAEVAVAFALVKVIPEKEMVLATVLAIVINLAPLVSKAPEIVGLVPDPTKVRAFARVIVAVGETVPTI